MGRTFKVTTTLFLFAELREAPGTAAHKSLMPLDLLSLNKEVKKDMCVV